MLCIATKMFCLAVQGGCPPSCTSAEPFVPFRVCRSIRLPSWVPRVASGSPCPSSSSCPGRSSTCPCSISSTPLGLPPTSPTATARERCVARRRVVLSAGQTAVVIRDNLLHVKLLIPPLTHRVFGVGGNIRTKRSRPAERKTRTNRKSTGLNREQKRIALLQSACCTAPPPSGLPPTGSFRVRYVKARIPATT